jgi:hypothetical protein
MVVETGTWAFCQDCGQKSPRGATTKEAHRWAERHVEPLHSVVSVTTPFTRHIADLQATRREP